MSIMNRSIVLLTYPNLALELLALLSIMLLTYPNLALELLALLSIMLHVVELKN